MWSITLQSDYEENIRQVQLRAFYEVFYQYSLGMWIGNILTIPLMYLL